MTATPPQHRVAPTGRRATVASLNAMNAMNDCPMGPSASTSEEPPGKSNDDATLKLSLRQIDALIALHVARPHDTRYDVAWCLERGEPNCYIVDTQAKECIGGAISDLPHGEWRDFNEGRHFVQSIPKYTIYYQRIAPLWYDMLQNPSVEEMHNAAKLNSAYCSIARREGKGWVDLAAEAEAATTALAMCLCLLKYHGFNIEVLP